MSVYIKGMEMPETCEDCPFYVEADEMLETNDWCYVLERTLGRGTEKDIDGYDCPLVPVPEHGDLIDADALEKDIDKYIGGEESRSRFHHWVQVQSVVIPGDKGEET